MFSVLTVLIDSGAAGNFIDQDTVNQLNVPIQTLQQPCKIQAIDGGGGTISCCTEPFSLQIGALHKESIMLYITVSVKHPIILGLSWLNQHNSLIS